MLKINNNVRQQFAEHIFHKMKDKITGSNVDYAYNDKPQTQFFSGTLCSQNPRTRLRDIRTKVAPVRMGVEFLLKKDDLMKAELIIKPRASVFYKINPSYEDQLKLTIKKHDCSKEELIEMINEQCLLANEGKEDNNLGEKPLRVFKKYNINNQNFKCKFSEIVDEKFEAEFEVNEVKEKMIDRAFDAYSSDENVYWYKKIKKEEMDTIVPLSALKNEKTFNSFMDSWGEKEAKPSWSFVIKVKSISFNHNCVKISVIFENTCNTRENDMLIIFFLIPI
jgi:hypothetical protein